MRRDARFGHFLIVASACAVAACSGAPKIEKRSTVAAAQFDGRALIAIADVDMPAAGYVDGRLQPIAGAGDSLVVFPSPIGAGAPVSVPASNSVMAWPGSLDLSPDGRFAYVAELRAAPPGSLEKMRDVYDEMPAGKLLTAVDITDASRPKLVGAVDVGGVPTSVHVAPSNAFALVSVKDRADGLVAVVLEAGTPTRVIRLGFSSPISAKRDIDDGVMFVRLAPDGRTFVVNLANTHVAFGRLDIGPDGLPTSAQIVGAPLAVGEWLTIARWSNDGRHAVFADVAWGEKPIDAALNGPGALISIAYDEAGEHRVASTAQVSLSPEGFDMNRAGDLFVAVNMERTYLPDGLPYSLFGRRSHSSLSLVAFDAATGALKTADGPVGFEGVLPEDAVFDADGDMIAVAVFHDRAKRPDHGWVEFFRVETKNGAPRLFPTGRRLITPRGAHDLALAP